MTLFSLIPRTAIGAVVAGVVSAVVVLVIVIGIVVIIVMVVLIVNSKKKGKCSLNCSGDNKDSPSDNKVVPDLDPDPASNFKINSDST